MCADGSLGSILEVHLTLLNGGGLDPEGPLHWRHRTDYSGKNMMQLGIFNETIQRWLGDTTRVTAHARTFVTSRVDGESGERMSIEIPDSLGIFADMANGARCTYRVSAVTEGAPGPPSIEVYGTAGRIQWRFGDTGEWQRHGEELTAIEPDPGTAHGWQVDARLHRLRPRRRPSHPHKLRGRRPLHALHGCRLGVLEQGRAVDVPALE